MKNCLHASPKGSVRRSERKNGKWEAELFFINTVHKQDGFLGLISIRGQRDHSFKMTKATAEGGRAFQHVRGVRTAHSKRLEMLHAVALVQFSASHNEWKWEKVSS